MSESTVGAQVLEQLDAEEAAAAAPKRRSRRSGSWLLLTFTWLVIAWLMVPIAIIIVFSFNNTQGRFNTTWVGPTLKWYLPKNMTAIPDLTSALGYSLLIAVVATIGAVILGTGLGLALGKHRFRGQALLALIMFMAISAPDIVQGTSLESLFVTSGTPMGVITIIIGHIMFCLSFVAVVVRARVSTLDPSINEAARDLGASGWTTFWRVTLPMIFPAVLSGAMLSFALSIDDYVITSFVSGPVTTFPMWIYGASKLGVPPQAYVMGTLIFAVGVIVAVTNLTVSRRRAAR